jgi:hypothetical protein
MKKIACLLLIFAAATASLAAITVTPSSATINVAGQITASLSCVYGVSGTMDWGDGSTLWSGVDSSFNYPTPQSHTYRNPGTFTLHFHRSMPSGCPQDEYATVTVLENRSVSVTPASPYTGQTATLTAVNFQTPGNITWDMGDGTTYANRGSSITHKFSRTGSFLVRAFDWNGDTGTTPVSKTVNVTTPPRSISYSPSSPRVDQEVTIQALNFGSSSIDWNFGDGTPQATYSAAVAHRYQTAGTFTITAREHGTSLTPVTRSITILPENRSLLLSASEVRVNEPVTVKAVNFRGKQVLWDFGDNSTASVPKAIASTAQPAAFSGPTTITHVYKLPGNYTITARDENGVSQKTFKASIRILGISDAVNLEVAEITLDNGKYYKVVAKNSKNIRAQLRMKLRGTGIVAGYWIVDGQPYQFFSETAYQGQIKLILTPEVPGLPVFDPGMHTVTVQLTRPAGEAVVFPVLRYFVLPYENEIAVIAPKDGAVIKEDEVATFAWESVLGGSYYQIAFANSVFPLLRNDADLKWRDCPERFRFTPDAEAWGAIKRNEWTYWKVRAVDSGRAVVGESAVLEMKIIVPGAEVSLRQITDLDGNPVAGGSGVTASRSERLLIQGDLTYPADAEFLVLRVYANDALVDQLLFRDVRKDEVRAFETSVPNDAAESRVVFEILKSSSPSLLVGYKELTLKRE